MDKPINFWANSTSVLQTDPLPVLIMAHHTTHDSGETSPQLQGPVFMMRPSQASVDYLCNARTPARYLQAGLKMDSQICCKTQRIIRELALSHIDFSIPYVKQSPSRIEFFKREVLLDVELSHLMSYQDGWAVEVFLRIMFHRPGKMRDLQRINSELQLTQHDPLCQRQSNVHSVNLATNTQLENHDRSFQMPLTVRSDNRIARPEDAQHDLVCSDNQATQPEYNRVNTAQDAAAAAGTTSYLALLSALLASMPGMHRFHAVITKAGLFNDEHLLYFCQMTSTGREKFVTQALMENATLFERVVIMEILEELRNIVLVGAT